MAKVLSCITLMFILLAVAPSGYTADTSIINIYDASGNLITGDGRYYEYNDANRLARVRQGDQTGPVIAEYFYDSSGQRVKKIENGVVTYYVGKHFEKQVGGSNAGSTSYYFADDDKKRLFERIERVLEIDGALIVGSTESLLGSTQGMEAKRYLRAVYYQRKTT